MVLNLIRVYLFHCQIVNLLKILLCFGVENSLLLHADNGKKGYLSSIIAEAKHSTDTPRSRKKTC